MHNALGLNSVNDNMIVFLLKVLGMQMGPRKKLLKAVDERR